MSSSKLSQQLFKGYQITWSDKHIADSPNNAQIALSLLVITACLNHFTMIAKKFIIIIILMPVW